MMIVYIMTIMIIMGKFNILLFFTIFITSCVSENDNDVQDKVTYSLEENMMPKNDGTVVEINYYYLDHIEKTRLEP